MVIEDDEALDGHSPLRGTAVGLAPLVMLE